MSRGKIELRGKVWQASLSHNGTRYRFTTGKNAVPEAVEVYNRFLSELENPNTPIIACSFNELAIQFLQSKIRSGLSANTIGKYQDYIRILKDFFGDKNLKTINKLLLKQYEDYRMLKGDRAEYLREQLQTLQLMLNYAVEMELTNHNPFGSYKFKKHLPKYKPRLRFLTPLECQRLLDNCNDHLRSLVIFLLETGCRIGETLQLLFTDLALDPRTRLSYVVIRKEISKSKKQRIIPLTKLALEQISKQQRLFPNNIVIFTTAQGKTYKEHPKRSLTNALKKAGLKEQWGLFHLLRHTAGSLWLQGLNIDGSKRKPLRIELVAELLGHSNIVITKQIYAQFDKQDLITAFLEEDE
jgi:integrase